jgi:hypothetical protein
VRPDVCKHCWRNRYHGLNHYGVRIKTEGEKLARALTNAERKGGIPAVGRYIINRVERRDVSALQHWFLYNEEHQRWLGGYYDSPCLAAVSRQSRLFVDHPKRFRGLRADRMWDWCWGVPNNGEMQKEMNTPQANAWAYWLANESVWAPVFITKDPQEMFAHGTVYDLNQPARLVCQGASGMRYVREFRALPLRWAKFVEAGVDKDLACVMMHYYDFNQDGTLFGIPHTSNHSMWHCTRIGRKQLSNLLNRRIWQMGAATYSKLFGSVYPTADMWGPSPISEYKYPVPGHRVRDGVDCFGGPIYKQVNNDLAEVIEKLKEDLDYD